LAWVRVFVADRLTSIPHARDISCGPVPFTRHLRARSFGAIDDALQAARKRAIGTAGGWGWDRADETAVIYPIVSVTLALFGAEATKRNRSSGASFA
jgi:hypothetical protein